MGGAQQQVTPLVNAAARFLKSPDGPRIAVIDVGGWDTHANQGGAQGNLATRLKGLDAGMQTLKTELGPVWADTTVLVVTEFGRTVAVNGTRGTDHGTAGVAFLAGGAVKGGRVVSDWPGLAARELYENRDLKPTTDLRARVQERARRTVRSGRSDARTRGVSGQRERRAPRAPDRLVLRACARQPQEYDHGTIQPNEIRIIETADPRADLRLRNSHDLVDHETAENGESVSLARGDRQPE